MISGTPTLVSCLSLDDHILILPLLDPTPYMSKSAIRWDATHRQVANIRPLLLSSTAHRRNEKQATEAKVVTSPQVCLSLSLGTPFPCVTCGKRTVSESMQRAIYSNHVHTLYAHPLKQVERGQNDGCPVAFGLPVALEPAGSLMIRPTKERMAPHTSDASLAPNPCRALEIIAGFGFQ